MGKWSIAVLIIGISFGGACLFATASVAQDNVEQFTLNGFTRLASDVSTTGAIAGFVLDEAGHPVAEANVTLWQEGHLWVTPSNADLRICNPASTDVYCGGPKPYFYLGHFNFGRVDPGQYTLTVDKGGSRGFVNVSVGADNARDDSITGGTGGSTQPGDAPLNLTLAGFHASGYSQAELAYAGAIGGRVYSTGDFIRYTTIHLMQNSTDVDIPENPQIACGEKVPPSGGNYRFDHLAPGRYEVLVLACDDSGRLYIQSRMVTVGSGTNVTDVYFGRPPGYAVVSDPSGPAVFDGSPASAEPGGTPDNTPPVPAPTSLVTALPALFLATVLAGRLKKR